MKTITKECDQCDYDYINGTFCHETGCPNSPIGYVRECKWCGQSFEVLSLENTLFCSIDCGDSYYS